jgi:hypothetical protein
MGATRRKDFQASDTLLASACFFVALMFSSCAKTSQVPSAVAAAPPPDPLTLAVKLVEEDRAEATGRAAVVEVPTELKHYSDRRRFLAVQLAEARTLSYEAPRDFSELVGVIQAGKLVEMPPVSDEHLLYGVGENATEALFTHYDPTTGKDIPLYPSYDEFQKDFDEWTRTLVRLRDRVDEIGKLLHRTNRRDRQSRKALIDELRHSRKSSTELEQHRSLIASFYRSANKFSELSSEYQVLANLARDFSGQSYDLSKGDGRRRMKVRLLSFIRPEAREVLLELSRAYKARFDRPLPVTSLVRTGDYQRQLRRTNKNAAATTVPPHTTGLAFDVYDYYMSGAEQQYVMDEIARMKAEGRVEALRERRDHIHVFAFVNGKPPDDQSINAEVGKRKVGAKRAKARRS